MAEACKRGFFYTSKFFCFVNFRECATSNDLKTHNIMYVYYLRSLDCFDCFIFTLSQPQLANNLLAWSRDDISLKILLCLKILMRAKSFTIKSVTRSIFASCYTFYRKKFITRKMAEAQLMVSPIQLRKSLYNYNDKMLWLYNPYPALH